jgi:L-threonylcarbamoyladenylate synthase
MIEKILSTIKRGEVVILPLEHSYVYACDAFNFSAVNRLHQLRSDPPGVAAQVLIGKVQTLEGLAQGVTPEIKELVAAFWPGELTLNILRNQSLTWNLGDAGVLKEFAVRMPNQDQTLEVLRASGPLAVASATIAGGRPVRTPPLSANLTTLDIGELAEGSLSTVISARGSELEVIRVGALTLEALKKVVSAIELASE